MKIEDQRAFSGSLRARGFLRPRHRGNGFPAFMRFGLAAFLFLSWLAPWAEAQTNAPHPVANANRYLFVIETSRAMKSRSDGVSRAMEDLIGSGIGGQLRRGDTIAIWTYNADLHAGEFPLQQWTPETQKNVAIRILSFIKQLTYEKQPVMQKAGMAVDRVIRNSEFITVLLINDGSQPMTGTPFDAQINGLYQTWDKEQQKAHMPFVTVLRATKGKITHFTVTSAPWPVDMPPLPSELLLAATNAPKPAVDDKTNATPQVVRKPPPVGQPLIISGHKPEPPKATAGPTNTLVAAGATPQIIAPNPTVLKNETTAAMPAAQGSVAPTPSATEPPKVAQTPVPVPPPIVTSAPPPSTLVETPKLTDPKSIEPRSSAPPIVVKAEPAVTLTQATSAFVKTSPEPVVVAPAETPQASVSNPTAAATSPEPPADGQAATLSPAQSLVVPAQPLLSPKAFWIGGLAFGLVIVVLALLLMMRRNRAAASSSSLITRSFERERKP